MDEAMITDMMRLLVRERLAQADRVRRVRSALAHQALRKAECPSAPRSMGRRTGQAAY